MTERLEVSCLGEDGIRHMLHGFAEGKMTFCLKAERSQSSVSTFCEDLPLLIES